uniref:J domain-containing protein n=1 Tax=Timema cristinae TaxID=61476 RepID=A0A7R9H720_TIMCR|nr:unnamed protein product [Timema cristinae]
MSELLDLCRKYFGSRDLYEVLQISKSSDSKQVKKAYHKVSLLVHPDRVDENEKIEATEKFKVLGKVHSILNDKDKRKVYDETGSVGDDETADRDWNLYWDIIYKNITVEDISNYEKKYKDSDEELQDLKRAYLGGKGDMDLILELVPFTNTDEEPRLKKLIQGLIDRGEVPAFPAFTHESAQKKANRKRKVCINY